MSAFHTEYARRDIESAVFGHLMINKEFAPICFASIVADDFGNKDIRDGFEKIKNAYTITGLDITTEQRCLDLLTRISAEGELSLLTDASAAIDAVVLQSARRRLYSLCRSTRMLIDDPEITIGKVKESVDQFRARADDDRVARNLDSSPAAAMQAIRTQMERRSAGTWKPIESGFIDIDHCLHLLPGTTHAIVAEPGVGKSAFALSMMAHQLDVEGIVPGYFSLEMTKSMTAQRMVANRTTIPYEALMRNEMSEKDRGYLKTEMERMEAMPYRLFGDADSLSSHELCDIARHWVEHDGVTIIYVDQLSTIAHDRRQSKKDEFAETYKALCALARRLQVCVVILCQQRRTTDSTGKRKAPKLSDIKECSNIAEDSDGVIMLFRPESEQSGGELIYQVDGKDFDMAGKAVAYIRKNRSGPTFNARLEYSGETFKFTNAMWFAYGR